jgi:hypothetical protein
MLPFGLQSAKKFDVGLATGSLITKILMLKKR